MRLTRPRPAVRVATALVAAAGLVLGAAAPALAHADRERIEQMRQTYAAGMDVPLLTSPNVKLVANDPGSTGISGCFMPTAPLFVMSNLDSVKVYDVNEPLKPKLTGVMPSAQFENEAMNCGERKTPDGTQRFALIGVDLYQASPDDIEHVNVRPRDGYELIIVDVTDPANPHVRSRAAGTTSTHTVACIQGTDCKYAYSAGSSRAKAFSIFDLTDLDDPKEIDSDPSTPEVDPFPSPTAGHKWNFDTAGFGTHTGFGGSSMFDVSKPRKPELVTTTGEAGEGKNPDGTANGYNDFIHHNSFRPNAHRFKPNRKPSIRNGNVLLVTEEDYEQTDCSKAGSFQTWHVKRLDGTPGAIVPLDKVELSDLGNFPVPQGAFCSAHWFDYHPSGVVTVGYYGGGMQLVDVRKPRKLSSYGHAVWGASEVWDAYWAPHYDKRDRAGKKTNVVYAVDLIRGLDVYAVELPGSKGSGSKVSLGSTNPFAVFAWPEDAVPLALVVGALGGAVLLRRRAAAHDRVNHRG